LEVLFRITILGLSIGAIYALIAVGLNLLWGTMRMLNIAHGSLIMIGAYITWLLFTSLGINPFLSGIIGATVLGIVGFAIYKGLFSSSIMKAKSLESLEGSSLLIFFGILIIIENTALLIWSGTIQGYNYMTEAIDIIGIPMAMNRVIAAIIAVVVCVGFYIFLQKTLFGKAIRAVIQDKEATELMGINTNKIYTFCFCVAFFMAGLAGMLISMLYSISPFMGQPYTMLAFVVIILGGLGNILGSLLGGLILGFITTAIVALTSPGYSFAVQYLLLVLVIILMPSGILGRRMQ